MAETPDDRPLWRRHLPGALVGLATGCLLGALGYAFLLGEAFQARWEQTLSFGVRGGITAILATLFTYFLVNRHLRRREREADLLVAGHLAEVFVRLQDWVAAYGCAGEEGRDSEAVTWLRGLLGADGDGPEVKGSRWGLEKILLRLRGIPTLYRAAISDLEGVEVLISRVTSLLGACSPRMARSIPALMDQLAFDLREGRVALLRASEAWDELERICVHLGAGTVDDDEKGELLQRIASGVAGCDDLTRDFDEFERGPLARFRQQAWPAHAAAEFEATVRSLKAFGEAARV